MPDACFTAFLARPDLGSNRALYQAHCPWITGFMSGICGYSSADGTEIHSFEKAVPLLLRHAEKWVDLSFNARSRYLASALATIRLSLRQTNPEAADHLSRCVQARVARAEEPGLLRAIQKMHNSLTYVDGKAKSMLMDDRNWSIDEWLDLMAPLAAGALASGEPDVLQRVVRDIAIALSDKSHFSRAPSESASLFRQLIRQVGDTESSWGGRLTAQQTVVLAPLFRSCLAKLGHTS